jgi:glycosyltransferase involved in cell wall biosynthesis
MHPAIRSAPGRTRDSLSPRSTAVLSVVVPVYNEAACLPYLQTRLIPALDALGIECELLFVNDGSTVGSGEWLDHWAASDSRVTILHLSRNFGHQPAVAAGLEHCHGEAVVVLDADLQDPPEVIAALIERWREGFDVVYAVRTRRKESLFKRAGYFAFYRLLRKNSRWNIPLDSGDFCLMDRRVVDAMNTLPETDRFIRGLRSFVGFRQSGVPYEREERRAGQTKYPLSKLVDLALNGFVNAGEFPIRWLAVGVLVFAAMSAAFGIAVGVRAAVLGEVPSGWVVILAVVLAVSSAQFAVLGLMAAYILKIFAEVKRRPSYILREVRRSEDFANSRAA